MVHSFFVILSALFYPAEVLSYFHIVLKRTGGTEPGRMVLGKGGLNEEHK